MRLLSLKTLIITLLCCFYWSSAQYIIPKKPQILYPVFDEAGLLNENQKQLLNDKLIKYEDSTSTEIEIIIIPSTKGKDINFLATLFGEKWKIGKKEVDNGVVFLIATEDRTMSIQQGRAVEQYLTASVVGQIIDYLVVPQFKKGDFFTGINNGTDAIIEALEGRFQAKPKSNQEEEFPLSSLILMFFILILIISFMNKNNRGGGSYYDDDDDVIISRRGRRTYSGGFGGFGGGSFGGGSSSGGGFGGFGGGGSFGGGGASGGW